MSSKFWVCIALISVAVTHTYIYTDLLKTSEPKVGADLFHFLDRIKNEWKSMLTSAKDLSRTARQGISNFREQTTLWRQKRLKKLQHNAK